MTGLAVEAAEAVLVPTWVIDLDVSDRALRLYVILLRRAMAGGGRPGHEALRRMLRCDALDALTAAFDELVAAGAVESGPATDLVRTRPLPGAAGPAAVHWWLRPAVMERFAVEVLAVRAEHRASVRLWSPRAIAEAMTAAASEGHSPDSARAALLRMAADRETHSPARLSVPGPWWESPTEPPYDLGELNEVLDTLDGLRVSLQAEARRRLQQSGLPATRTSVVTTAVRIARERGLLPVENRALSTDPKIDQVQGAVRADDLTCESA